MTVRLLNSESNAEITQNRSLRMLWYAPSRIGWVHFYSADKAIAAAAQSITLHGRQLSLAFQKPSYRQRTRFSVSIGNIGDEVEEENILNQFRRYKCPPMSISLEPLKYKDKDGMKIIKTVLEAFGPLEMYEMEAPVVGSLKRRAIARYKTGDACAQAFSFLTRNPDIYELGHGKLFVERLFTAKYTMDSDVFETMKGALNAVLSSIPSIRHQVFPSLRKVVIRVSCSDAVAISKVRLQVVRLLSGDVVLQQQGGKPLWHELLSRTSCCDFFSSLQAMEGVVVRCDTASKEIKLFGGSETAKEACKQSILAYVHSLTSSVQHAIPLPGYAWKALLSHGLPSVTESTGTHVSLSVKTRALLVQGDKVAVDKVIVYLARLTAVHSQAALIEGGTDRGKECPICLCPPDDDDEAVRLSCAHTYCKQW